MKSHFQHTTIFTLLIAPFMLVGCTTAARPEVITEVKSEPVVVETPEWFQLRPEVEKAYGYTHAVRVGDVITISGAVRYSHVVMVMDPIAEFRQPFFVG